MWFAYVERSMAWYDLDVAEVKKMVAQNKKGEKTPPLEDFKVNDIPLKSVDLIQENTIDRFERKNRNSGNNQNRKRPNNNNNNNNQRPQQRPQQRPENKGVAKPVGDKKPASSENNQPQNGAAQNQQPKKFKKKFHPKRDDKA